MRVLSANDDFCFRTLAAVEGSVRKLSYISGLRDIDGDYRHWGMQRTHGSDAANEAIASSHSQAWLQLLRAPLPELVAEIEKIDDGERDELLASLVAATALPEQLSGGSLRHFSSTVLALQLVFQGQSARRAA
ncbi:MAG: hypothetical protein ACRD3E_14455 [Terriglobales bacterium]